MLCVNNDPETKKILLEIEWNNWQEVGMKKEQLILDYNSNELKNFNLLNPLPQQSFESIDDNDISTLQKKLNEALEKEEYEKADDLQKKIDRLLKK